MANRARFEHLFREHYGAIAAFCLRRLDDEDASDVVAEVFTTTWDRLDDVDPDQTRAWLYAVARNKIAHRWRANGRRASASRRLAAERLEERPPDPADVVVEADVVETAALRLSSTDLELLQLVSWEGLGPDELAVVLDCSPGAAKVRVHRMRHRLQDAIDAMQPTADTGNTRKQGPSPRRRLEERR